MKISGSQIIIEVLLEQGCDCIFGYPGGQVINIYDALYENQDRIKHIITAHEQGAAHAADGYARATGKTGVVLATSGPGATNLVTGIATAYLDSVPLVAITGNVPCSLLGRDSFQEVDICGVTLPITKHNYIVKDINDLADTLREAFRIAKSGRPGPVLVDVPKDVQVAAAEFENKTPEPEYENPKASDEQLKTAAEMIKAADKPYLYCGGGVISGDAEQEVIQLAELIDAPIGCSMMGVSAIPCSNPRFLGMQGMHGHYASSMAQAEADLVIAIGARFSDRATGNKDVYVRNCKIIHIDVDNAEINKNVTSQLGINGDVKETLAKLNSMVEKKAHPQWHAEIDELKKKEAAMVQSSDVMTPYDIVEAVNEKMPEDAVIVTDVGQHQMWTAQHYKFEKPRTFISSGGLGTMGFGLGAAIGAYTASQKPTVLFTGDGSFGMNLNELATAVSCNAPVIVVIMNNGVLGMVRQWQTLFFNKHYSNTTLCRQTDFVKLAESFGALGMRAESKTELSDALDKAIAAKRPAVIDCKIDMDEFVLPMLPPGGSIDNIITEIHGGEI
ncbi:MAG: biosynthetic-type acetolactate synthase large subunit [Clostridium sp.]|nr:biosynthetic-type acetolactate synthase large subunit [Clostridium sp.]MCM1548042.1 biosynthetic-type acetolactate synthase large subunit [Ruminococcus sp.]